ncbi:MAG: amino acid permease, partial [Bacteroidetes bacterium]|nr:amino acid permease [Bacteroidota bacterium]
LNHPRAVFAAARDGLLPDVLSRVHPKYPTPHAAILFCAAIACGLALTGAFKTLAIVSSGSLLLLYLGCCLAVLRLRRMAPSAEGPVFRIPFGPVVPLASCLVIGWLLLSMTRSEVIGLSILLGVSALYYVLFCRRR